MSDELQPPVGPDDHSEGPADAPVTLVEYGDFQCPYCGAAYPVVKDIQRRLGAKMRFAFRSFPLKQSHPNAEHAAELAEAAATRGKFWEMHTLLFEHQRALGDRHLLEYAEQAGLDPAWAAQVLEEGTFARKVSQSFRSGVKSGVNGTPTFFINGFRYDGPAEAEAMVEAMEAAVDGGR